MENAPAQISNKLKDHILASIGEGVFTVDKNFRINFFNKAAEKITGYKKDEVIGRFCKHIIQSNHCFDNCPISQVLQKKENLYDFDSKIIDKFGNSKPIKLNSAVLYNDDDEPTGGIVTFRDNSELAALKKTFQKHSHFQGIVGQSKKMLEVFDLIKEISDTDAPVFITGESGTGKELVANAIQNLSPRKTEPYIKLNCSVFPSNLLASELFGHVKGSFTDAVSNRIGRFEAANNGTLFLDEVAEMPLQMQLQLLRVLQEGTFERVGESVTRQVDVRVIAATNIDIETALKNKSFRDDLYYRLNVIPIEIPPLRNRSEDILLLIDHFLQKFSITYKKNIREVDDKVLDCLMSYNWPGNVRELENVLEFAFVKTPSDNIIIDSKLPPKIKQNNDNSFSLKKSVIQKTDNSEERQQLLRVLETYQWNRSKAAENLGIGRTTLWRKMKELGIE